MTTREGAVADREAALQGRSDRVAAREAACRVSEAQAVERKAYFQGGQANVMFFCELSICQGSSHLHRGFVEWKLEGPKLGNHVQG